MITKCYFIFEGNLLFLQEQPILTDQIKLFLLQYLLLFIEQVSDWVGKVTIDYAIS